MQGEELMVISVTKSNFEKEVLKSKLQVMIELWAGWCAPCKIIAPLIVQLARVVDGRVIV